MPRVRRPITAALREAYVLMRARHGHQDWWPGETPFEVCLGAILTQNTAWANVERALDRLRAANLLSARALFALSETRLAEHLRPAGCHRVKARRVRAFLESLLHDADGNVPGFLRGDPETVRRRLLDIPGIGPETADCMLLYAGGHRRFVIDAYTRRVFSRHGWCAPDADYATLQRLCETALGRSAAAETPDDWGDYHAQLVRVGKDHCRKAAPRCAGCPLEPLLLRQAPESRGPPPANPACRRRTPNPPP